MTLGELESRMDAAEYLLWIGYARVHGLDRPPLQAGIVAATVANAANPKNRKKPSDFMPVRQPERPLQAAEEGLARARAIFGRHAKEG